MDPGRQIGHERSRLDLSLSRTGTQPHRLIDDQRQWAAVPQGRHGSAHG
jgi:hypothetical protein